jgi:hypothetical protein
MFLLASLLVTATALHFLAGNVADPDLWGHVRYGQMILDGHGLPREDVFSYTAPGAPFYDHEWLTDLVFASLFAVGGSAALVALKLLLSAIMLLAMLDAIRRTWECLTPDTPPHPLTIAAVLIAALAVIAPGATFRPQLFTMVFLALEVSLLLRADRRFESGSVVPPQLVALPPMVLAWANLHGGFLVGLGLLGVYCATRIGSALVQRARGVVADLEPQQMIALGAVGLIALAAPLVNPYGVLLYTYLADTLDMHGEISEWFPVALFDTEFLRFKLLCLAAIVSAVLAWRLPRPEPRARVLLAWMTPFLVVTAVLAFRHQRHTVLFGIAVAPLLVIGCEQLRRWALRRWPELQPRRPVFAAVAGGALAIALVQVWGFGRTLVRDGLEIRYGRLDYPIDAVEFMRTHDIKGNVAMPFEWGAYAIAKLAPDSRVFIDGRFEAVYPPQVIDDYFAFMHGSDGWERLLDAYPTDVVVVQRWRNIHPRLFAHADFQYVYSDPAALIFVRRSPANDPALERLASLGDRFDFPRNETVFP